MSETQTDRDAYEREWRVRRACEDLVQASASLVGAAAVLRTVLADPRGEEVLGQTPGMLSAQIEEFERALAYLKSLHAQLVPDA